VPLRKQVLATNEVYHITNRGVDSTPIFRSVKDYQRFTEQVDFYRFNNSNISFSNFKKLEEKARQEYMGKLKKNNDLRIKIYSYCLMPNHFHFLVKQTKDKGIEKTFSNIQNSFARYFNLKNKRAGPLFQSRFRAHRIERDEVYLHVSRYIHLNPATGYLVEPSQLISFKWSSFQEYLGLRNPLFTEISAVLTIIGGAERYKNFVLNQADYQRTLDRIKHLLLEG